MSTMEMLNELVSPVEGPILFRTSATCKVLMFSKMVVRWALCIAKGAFDKVGFLKGATDPSLRRHMHRLLVSGPLILGLEPVSLAKSAKE
jgi:hypothetical protein